ncbi:CLUMA_CG005866, isoform A [Clunio marinus]|uniref:CLUMA_CG005866, isoform A n=1 Tax=Clunio marinus TaxID=568069 RepID=A0A1J1HY98_9DIPT|nr:CLUMA_CG005866, isoform A [Clunio marinus]
MEETNQNKTIYHLPEEIIAKIFKSLNTGSLKSAALACKLWNDIASRMDWKLKLDSGNASEYHDAWIEELLESKRKFVSVKLESKHEWNNRLVDIFEKHGNQVQLLTLYSCTINNMGIFCKILNAMLKLKKIVCLKTSTENGLPTEFAEGNLPQLQKLETLELADCSYNMLGCFEKAQINTFKIYGSYNDEKQDSKILFHFLATQKYIKCLALRQLNEQNCQIFESPIKIENVPFKLKKLSLWNIKLRETPNDYNNLLKFLQFHSNTVEELELRTNYPSFIIEYIFSKFKRLSSLRIDGEIIPKDLSFYQRLEVNPSVKRLIIFCPPKSSDTSKEFYKHIPNVETLVIVAGSVSSMAIASSVFTRLKHLEVPHTYETFDNDFKRLSSLRIDGEIMPEELNFYERLEINPSVKRLIIYFPRRSNDVIKEFYKHIPNVETLVIVAGSVSSMAIASSVFTRLKHLEVPCTNETFGSDVKFPNLRTIYFGCISCPIDWTTLAANNPKVTKIRIETIKGSINYVMMLSQMKLQILDLTAIYTDDNFFKALRENTQDLKLFRIHKDSFEGNLPDLSDIKCLSLNDDAFGDCIRTGEFWDYGDYEDDSNEVL